MLLRMLSTMISAPLMLSALIVLVVGKVVFMVVGYPKYAQYKDPDDNSSN